MAKKPTRFLLAEPTTGFPRFSLYKQILSRKLSERAEDAAIINLDFNKLWCTKETTGRNTTEPDSTLSSFLGVRTFNLCSFIDSSELIDANMRAQKEAEILLCNDPGGKCQYRTLQWENTRIGLYVASHLYRHNSKLCIPGNEASEDNVLTTIRYYISCGLVLKILKDKIDIAAMLATHDIYFWGFITEYAATIEIPSLTYLGGFKPTIKTRDIIELRNSRSITLRVIPENGLFFEAGACSDFNVLRFIYEHLSRRTETAPIDTYIPAEKDRVAAELEAYSRSLDKLQKVNKDSITQKQIHAKVLLFCLHSFNDANFDWGYSGFDTIWEYFQSIAEECQKHNQSKYSFIIRPHPDIFRDWGDYDSIQHDKEINYLFLKEMARISSSVLIAGPDISMASLLQIPNIIPVTHHSYNIAIEAALHKKRCISGNCNPILAHLDCDLDIVEDTRSIVEVINRSFELNASGKPCIGINEAIQFASNELIDPLIPSPTIDNVWSRPWSNGNSRLSASYLERISHSLDTILNAQISQKGNAALLSCNALIEVITAEDERECLFRESELIISKFVERACLTLR